MNVDRRYWQDRAGMVISHCVPTLFERWRSMLHVPSMCKAASNEGGHDSQNANSDCRIPFLDPFQLQDAAEVKSRLVAQFHHWGSTCFHLDHCWTAFESIGVETWKLDEAWPGRTFAVRLDRAYRAEFQKSKSWSWAWTEEKSMAVANCVFPRLRCEGRPRMAQIAHGRLMWMSHMSHCDNSSNPCPAVSVTGEGQWMAAWGTASQRNAGGLRRGTWLIWCNGENPGRKRQGERRWEKEKGERRSQALKIPLTRRERCVQRCRKRWNAKCKDFVCGRIRKESVSYLSFPCFRGGGTSRVTFFDHERILRF